jgi:hypothetical protein
MNTMTKKLVIGLIPFIITAAFGVMVAGAQAEKAVWLKNGTELKNATPEPTISWGTLSLESSAGNVSCKNAAAGNVENNTTKPNGNTGATVLFATYECKNTGGECTAHGGTEEVLAESLPWPGAYLEEAGGEEKFRATEANEKITVNILCKIGPTVTGNLVFKAGPVGAETGTSEPAWLNGTSAAKPSEVSFDAKSGHLLAEQKVEQPAPIIIEGNAKTTAGSNAVKGTKFVTLGVKVGQIVTGGADVPIPTSLNQASKGEPLAFVESVTETEILLGELAFNGTEYVPTGKPIDANATGTFTLQFNSGSNVFATVIVKGTTKGKVKVVGYEGAPSLFTLR